MAAYLHWGMQAMGTRDLEAPDQGHLPAEYAMISNSMALLATVHAKSNSRLSQARQLKTRMRHR